MIEDTICAISTPAGIGGISIIRISGSDSISITNNIFKGRDLNNVSTHTINYGFIKYQNEIIDEALVSIMRGPKTYTTEDVVEINLHGGIATTNRVLQILLENGCRLAEPGEFTKRAFLNGRIDLVEAEAVSDIINSESENARNISVNNLTGGLSKIIRELKKKILTIESHIEVKIDYPEYDDIEDVTNYSLENDINEVELILKRLIDESSSSKIIKNGANVAIIGKPNVGKSSILNALIGEEKAIVTNIQGTTRDIIEGKMVLDGNIINFLDTAGIRTTTDEVEKIGVERSLKQIEEADLIILVLNNNEKISKEEKELLANIRNKHYLIFVNKSDLPKKIDIKSEYISGNTKNIDGLTELKKAISEYFKLNEIKLGNMTYISNARQLSLITKAKCAIERAKEGCIANIPVDIIEEDLKEARKSLSLILGEDYDNELMDELFSNFCLGK